MTTRYSNPSQTVGVDRFEVWPSGGDSYSHSQLAANWDTLDALIGLPSSGSAWPPSTGLNGGIYKEITLLQNDRTPIGSVFAWFRPSGDVPIPDGCVVCDGSVLTEDEHDFPGIDTSVTLPNLINSFVLGANPNTAIGTAGVAVTNGNINNENGAPGPQGTGGSNTIVQSEAQLAPHNHGGQTEDTGFDNESVQLATGAGSSNVLLGSQETNEQGDHHHVIDTDGSAAPMDNRPLYVGLIYLCKVLYSSSV